MFLIAIPLLPGYSPDIPVHRALDEFVKLILAQTYQMPNALQGITSNSSHFQRTQFNQSFQNSFPANLPVRGDLQVFYLCLQFGTSILIS